MAKEKTNWVLWGGLAAGAGAAWYFLSQKASTMPLMQSASLAPITVPQPPVTQVNLSPNGLAVTNADGTTTVTNSPAHAAALLSSAAISPSTVLNVTSAPAPSGALPGIGARVIAPLKLLSPAALATAVNSQAPAPTTATVPVASIATMHAPLKI